MLDDWKSNLVDAMKASEVAPVYDPLSRFRFHLGTQIN